MDEIKNLNKHTVFKSEIKKNGIGELMSIALYFIIIYRENKKARFQDLSLASISHIIKLDPFAIVIIKYCSSA